MLLHAPPHDPLVYGGMLFLSLAVPAWTVMTLFVRRGAAFLAIALMLGASGWMAEQGLLLDVQQIPPLIAMLAAVSLIAALWLGTAGGRHWLQPLAGAKGIQLLLIAQVFRLPLELLMLRATLQGIMPTGLSMLGYNWDVITGLAAGILAAWPWSRGHALPLPTRAHWLCVAVWNVWGAVCLSAILVLAVLTSPPVHAFGKQPDGINSWVLFFPYVWLPVVLDPFAVLGHALVTRWLIDNRARAL